MSPPNLLVACQRGSRPMSNKTTVPSHLVVQWTPNVDTSITTAYSYKYRMSLASRKFQILKFCRDSIEVTHSIAKNTFKALKLILCVALRGRKNGDSRSGVSTWNLTGKLIRLWLEVLTPHEIAFESPSWRGIHNTECFSFEFQVSR